MQDKWQEMARDLYEALLQMKHSRGVDMGDIELVMDAKEKYEEMSGTDTKTIMWLVKFHNSEKGFWKVACLMCDAKQVSVAAVEFARRWRAQHECVSREAAPADAEHEE